MRIFPKAWTTSPYSKKASAPELQSDNKKLESPPKIIPLDPLDLSKEDWALFRCSAFQIASFALPLIGSFNTELFTQSIITSPTNLKRTLFALGFAAFITLPLQKDSARKTQDKIKEFAVAFASSFLAPAPVRTVLQGYMTYNQASRACSGLKSCWDQIGKRDPLEIAQTAGVHAVNLFGSLFNLYSSVLVTYGELPYYKALSLRCMGYSQEDVAHMIRTDQVESIGKNFEKWLHKENSLRKEFNQELMKKAPKAKSIEIWSDAKIQSWTDAFRKRWQDEGGACPGYLNIQAKPAETPPIEGPLDFVCSDVTKKYSPNLFTMTPEKLQSLSPADFVKSTPRGSIFSYNPDAVSQANGIPYMDQVECNFIKVAPSWWQRIITNPLTGLGQGLYTNLPPARWGYHILNSFGNFSRDLVLPAPLCSPLPA